MYSNLKRHLKLVALRVEEAEAQVQLRNRDAWWWQSWQWYWITLLATIFIIKNVILVSTYYFPPQELDPSQRWSSGQHQGCPTRRRSRCRSHSHFPMSCSLLQSQRGGEGENVISCSIFVQVTIFFTLFSHSQLSPQVSIKITFSDFIHYWQ